MPRKLLIGTLICAGGVALTATPALAQPDDPLAQLADPEVIERMIQNARSLVSIILGFMVLLFLPGLALFEAGSTGVERAGNLKMRTLSVFGVVILGYFAFGHGIANGSDWASLIGTDVFFLSGSSMVFDQFFFDTMLVATVTAAACMALTDRLKLWAQLVFAFVMGALIVPMVFHSVWGGGTISEIEIGGSSFIDGAGGTILFITAGATALAADIILGDRHKTGETGSHSVMYGLMGGFLIWVAWLGLVANSSLHDASATDLLTRYAVMALLAGAAGGLVSNLMASRHGGHSDPINMFFGVLTGLVAVSAGVHVISSLGALIIGALAPIVGTLGVALAKKLKIDDPMHIWGIAWLTGLWGTLAVGLFAEDSGLFYGGGVEQLITQLVGAVIVTVGVAVLSLILFAILKAAKGRLADVS